MENITEQLKAALAATQDINQLDSSRKESLLKDLADAIVVQWKAIIVENEKDLSQLDIDDPKRDRLVLNEERIHTLARSVLDVAQLADPAGKLLSEQVLENGLLLQKKAVPLGVVAVIYESRPNVTIDVASLCIRSGNVCLLRGGTDAFHTNSIFIQIIQGVLLKHNLNPNIVQLLPTDRRFVQELLEATKYVDIIIPRGSQSLIDFVRTHAKVPVIETGAGVCHTYVEQSASIDKAVAIVANAKISRPSVCNALDTILLDEQIAVPFLEGIINPFVAAKVEVFADEKSYALLQQLHYPYLQKAEEADFGREFLDLKCSVKVLNGLGQALTHIATHSSRHSECMVSNDPIKLERFMNAVDAAAVYANASTRFTDGGEFGLGAEIGISTQKLHARGPFALEKLVTEKWFVTGNGQIR
ncbi:glutamate-5-semialdehyde dehydrogenase [Sphingobacterium sp. SRCM116780]|uniref:glutamate-5-semialdehyde dehydrogenase n=1 Tax=Sphingobacterium sp. SRCM116780 TaxID=2907623 RepID=UPI001F21B7CD|nr:glutamate-5-semialdehyde dehydrogenase [Sphingobacterium sp. SRCM116780]UIR55334.1 glutamate-5-semialdehyde dehydrogenase [Sphingobacterium sp. SRCM116780]